ncbi:unnamed protein product [Rotaria sp. Silwood1]|nr:unnamed protein product [Rotaria sp. Silwood1]CAF0767224.1 unnamed protein product [Rotaria sp. Silwood1]CAF0783524.1 unnamed protein product [Rotaria sp. Silwood1]CAF3324361.1 unnamed protein product [Rotaria sp. Silwood1]CAF3340616.1 unnamed protein product [Rotaria sp. Silwood1]
MLKLHRCLFSLRSIQQFCRSQSTNAYSSKWVSPLLQKDLEKFSSSNPLPISICLIGDPHLRRSNELVLNLQHDFVQAAKLRLHYALADFRRKNGFGRGISACQIGINLRMIALNLGYGSLTLINPKIIWSSSDTITMWDDCMSIPRILVKKQRAKSISIVYTDDNGNEQKWNELDVSISELLQHEMDHLNGILNIDKPFIDDRANGKESIISMDQYEKEKNYFDQQVDYIIVPTV